MKYELRQRLAAAGIDADAAVERFMGSEELYLRFFISFPRTRAAVSSVRLPRVWTPRECSGRRIRLKVCAETSP